MVALSIGADAYILGEQFARLPYNPETLQIGRLLLAIRPSNGISTAQSVLQARSVTGRG